MAEQARSHTSRRDITGDNSLAQAVHGVLEEIQTLDYRDYSRYFEHYRQQLVSVVQDPQYSASDRQRQRWADSFGQQRSMLQLLQTAYNMYLAAGNLRVDRGSSREAGEFGHWQD
jgi:hypothetical protein